MLVMLKRQQFNNNESEKIASKKHQQFNKYNNKNE